MELVAKNGDRVTTTSLIIAEMFDKDHKKVLNDIESLECSQQFTKLNFEASEYKGRNGANKFYFITRDGFAFLAMGYSGIKAAKFKETFINAFNLMAEELAKQTSNKTPTLLATYQLRMLSEPAKSCPSNRWCIFDQAGEIMLFIEKEIGSVSEYDLADGSIGIHWAKFREGKNWTKPFTHYYHEFNDKRGKHQSKCYEYTELEYFKVWLREVYKTTHLYDYLHNKYKKDNLMLPRVEVIKSKLIENGERKAA